MPRGRDESRDDRPEQVGEFRGKERGAEATMRCERAFLEYQRLLDQLQVPPFEARNTRASTLSFARALLPAAVPTKLAEFWWQSPAGGGHLGPAMRMRGGPHRSS